MWMKRERVWGCSFPNVYILRQHFLWVRTCTFIKSKHKLYFNTVQWQILQEVAPVLKSSLFFPSSYPSYVIGSCFLKKWSLKLARSYKPYSPSLAYPHAHSPAGQCCGLASKTFFLSRYLAGTSPPPPFPPYFGSSLPWLEKALSCALLAVAVVNAQPPHTALDLALAGNLCSHFRFFQCCLPAVRWKRDVGGFSAMCCSWTQCQFPPGVWEGFCKIWALLKARM